MNRVYSQFLLEYTVLIDAIAKLLLLPIRNMTNWNIGGPTLKKKHIVKTGPTTFCNGLFRALSALQQQVAFRLM